ncbi:MAG: Asp-tRNA(Asn)/Glu-tRNA(Gln) amidotransferase subunit GatB, partial [Chloroflexota bacterium]
SGMPGVLPVINQTAVEFALRVALALNCEIYENSIFARKSYFYPDLPKGYQISQYEDPLARNGLLTIETSAGEQVIRIRRVHIEEDTGKLTHVKDGSDPYTLVDLNRSGIPLLEIVTEPDMHSVESVRNYAVALRRMLRYLGVNSGNLEKGLFRVEPNISLRPVGSKKLGTRTEIKNLNSFRALERGVEYEIERQTEILQRGEEVIQETVGWDDTRQKTFPQRSKEDADDYRYFPEPDLPPLVVEDKWVATIKESLPELPYQKKNRFMQQYDLNAYDAGVLVAEKLVADYFEAILALEKELDPKLISNWISGELFRVLNEHNIVFEELLTTASDFAKLLMMIASEDINQNTAKKVLEEMVLEGKSSQEIVAAGDLSQISDSDEISNMVAAVLQGNSDQVAEYLAGKETISAWLFGQVMRASKGKANPQVLRKELDAQLKKLMAEK